ncbi:MAG: LacI family DNA-binding transcriptional regulator [Pseudomonadota bacterium]
MNLKQLAAHLKLSQTTVSRALNGYPEVSEATRRRVLEAANRFNYRPNARAKSLATGRAMAIGHVMPVSAKGEIVNPIFADFIAGASETYSQNNYAILLSVVSDGTEERVYRDFAAQRSVDGVLLHAPQINDHRIELLRSLGLPFLVHGRASGEAGPYSWLDVNNRRAFLRGTEFLVDLGHTRISLVNGHEHLDFAVRRRDGYLRGLRDRGVMIDEALMCSGEMSESYGYQTASEHLGWPDPPTAFLVSSMITANGVARAVHEAGLALGKDVSLVTFDDDLSYFSNRDEEAHFTALRSSVRQAGQKSAEMLMTLIANPTQGPLEELLEADLVIGRSTGPAPALDGVARAAIAQTK